MQEVIGLSPHARRKKGGLVQTAHAATFSEVKLTNYRLEEASSDAAELRGVDGIRERERERERFQRRENGCAEGGERNSFLKKQKIRIRESDSGAEVCTLQK